MKTATTSIRTRIAELDGAVIDAGLRFTNVGDQIHNIVAYALEHATGNWTREKAAAETLRSFEDAREELLGQNAPVAHRRLLVRAFDLGLEIMSPLNR